MSMDELDHWEQLLDYFIVIFDCFMIFEQMWLSSFKVPYLLD